ncbi:MAG: hypothetical protein V5B36_00010 [Candidatus Accumulibacter sp. UW25]
MMPVPPPLASETFLAMFCEEWRLARGNDVHNGRSPASSIVDTRQADEQYLAPEFELFRVNSSKRVALLRWWPTRRN